MSSPSTQPDPHGSFSPENAPGIVVRAGKTFLCSSCGTLVEVPADVVGQLVWAEQSPRPEPPAEVVATSQVSPQASTRSVPAHRPARRTNVQTQKRAPITKSQASRPPRPKRPQEPARATWAGQAIDGLPVPTGHQLDHAFKWITFHLKVLDGQNTEIKRLKKLLKTESTNRVPRPSPLGRAGEVTPQVTRDPSTHPTEKHAQADLGVAPGSDDQHQRGPP